MDPSPLWKLNLKVMQRFLTFMTVALYDQSVRDLMGYTWTARQQWLARPTVQRITLATKVLPSAC